MKPPDRLVEEVKKARGLIDDYLGSVRGLYAFAEAACFDAAAKQRVGGSNYSIPRTMTLASGGVITPDGVVQPRANYGIVAEMKKHFRDGDDDGYIDQVKKYDQDLTGWWTKGEKLTPHDLVLLTNILSTTNATDALEKWKKGGKSFTRPFAIVEYTYTDGAQRYFLLRRMAGALSDRTFDEALRRGKPVPDSVMVMLFAQCKLCDAKPPLMHMLVLLYMETVPLFVTEKDFESTTGRLRRHVTVTVAEVRDKMEEQFNPQVKGTRQPTLPKKEWVREALDALEDMELAKRDGREKFHIRVQRPPQKDALQWLVAKWLKAQDRKSGAKRPKDKAQVELELFADQPAAGKSKKRPRK